MTRDDGPLANMRRWLAGASGWTIGLATLAVSALVSAAIFLPWGFLLIFAVFPFGLERWRGGGRKGRENKERDA